MATNQSYIATVGVKVNDTQLKAQLSSLSSKTLTLNVSGLKGVTSGINNIDKNIKNITTSMSKFKTTSNDTLTNTKKKLNSTSRSAMTLGNKFVDIGKKVIAFGAITKAIGLVVSAMSKAIEITKEYSVAQVEFQKVSEQSGIELENYTKKLAEMGEEVGRTRTELLKASTEFKKSDYTDEESAQLAKVTALYQNTADEILSASEASSVLISQLKAFNITAEDSIDIIDSINAVSANFAVSSSDIGKGLTASSASLSTYGNTFSETIGLLTAGTTIFQGQSTKVATGLNMIASRISKNEDVLKGYGISIYDTNGNLRSTYDILADLQPQWEKMSNTEQVALGQTLAG